MFEFVETKTKQNQKKRKSKCVLIVTYSTLLGCIQAMLLPLCYVASSIACFMQICLSIVLWA